MNIRGYTLLEVSLFLAISSGLTAVALVGLGPRLTNVRFTSAMRGLQESVTKQISASELGQNSASKKYSCSSTGTNLNVVDGDSNSSTCVYVGKLAVFDSSGVNFRPIIALRSKVACGATDPYTLESVKNCNLARVMNTDSTTYQYSNGISRTSDPPIGYGYVKSPDNNSVHRFILQGPFSTGQFQLSDTTSISTDKKVCYSLSRRNAQLIVSASSAEPKLEFNGVCT